MLNISNSNHSNLNNINIVAADPLESLPTDKIMPSHSDIQLVTQLFPKQIGIVEKLCLNIQDTILVGIIIYLFGIPQIDTFLTTSIPFTRSSNYKLFLVKSIFAMLLFYTLTTFILVRKN